MQIEFSRKTFKKFSKYMKICSVPAELFMRTGRLTNGPAFFNFANAYKNSEHVYPGSFLSEKH